MNKLPLDLSKFRKVKQDKHTSTFKHHEGHEITIAHNKLSSKMRDALNKLPVSQQKTQKFDEGSAGVFPLPNGGMTDQQAADYAQSQPAPEATTGTNPDNTGLQIEPVDASDSDSQPQAVASINAAPDSSSDDSGDDGAIDLGSQAARGPAAKEASMEQVTPQEAQAANQQPTTPDPQQVQQAEQAPISPQAQFAADKDSNKQEMLQQAQAWMNDLSNQHVTPETYHDLFAKKGTLGKIGTLFGLMVGGIGGGLTHTQSAAQKAMDTELQNDFEAQKQSKNNAQNFLRLSQQHEMNQAQMKLMGQQGALIPAQVAQMKAETDAKAFGNAQIRTKVAGFHSLVDMVDKMPDGPQKEQYKQTLALVYQNNASQIANIADQAAGAAAYSKMLFPAPSSGANPEQNFQQQTMGMRRLGPQGEQQAKFMQEHHVPGLPGQASIPLDAQDREKIRSGMQFDQQLHRFMGFTQTHSGDLNPKDIQYGAALAKELGSAYRAATDGGVYKKGEQTFINQQIDPSPTKFFNNLRVMPQLNAMADEHRSRMDNIVKSYGFPGYQGVPQAQSAQQAQPQYKIVKGVKYQRGPNGEAIRVQ